MCEFYLAVLLVFGRLRGVTLLSCCCFLLDVPAATGFFFPVLVEGGVGGLTGRAVVNASSQSSWLLAGADGLFADCFVLLAVPSFFPFGSLFPPLLSCCSLLCLELVVLFSSEFRFPLLLCCFALFLLLLSCFCSLLFTSFCRLHALIAVGLGFRSLSFSAPFPFSSSLFLCSSYLVFICCLRFLCVCCLFRVVPCVFVHEFPIYFMLISFPT